MHNHSTKYLYCIGSLLGFVDHFVPQLLHNLSDMVMTLVMLWFNPLGAQYEM